MCNHSYYLFIGRLKLYSLYCLLDTVNSHELCNMTLIALRGAVLHLQSIAMQMEPFMDCMPVATSGESRGNDNIICNWIGGWYSAVVEVGTLPGEGGRGGGGGGGGG